MSPKVSIAVLVAIMCGVMLISQADALQPLDSLDCPQTLDLSFAACDPSCEKNGDCKGGAKCCLNSGCCFERAKGKDCSTTLCALVRCFEGYELKRTPGQCCPRCKLIKP